MKNVDKVVALAEKHFGAYAHQAANIFTAMLADHRQQVIEELANKPGVMPLIYDGNWCDASEVREAFATMQAQCEQTEEKYLVEKGMRRLAEARVGELEKALDRIAGMCDVPATCTCGRPNGLPAVVACAKTAMKGQQP
jgi:hypothetical protein